MFYFVIIKTDKKGHHIEGLFVDRVREVALEKAKHKAGVLQGGEEDENITYEVREAVGS